MLDNYFVQTCYKVSPTRDQYGDYINGTHTAIPCRFREINTVKRGTHQEINDSDAMLWVAPGSGIEKGNIIFFEDYYYQVERITKARRLGSNVVQFIKCDLKITDIGFS